MDKHEAGPTLDAMIQRTVFGSTDLRQLPTFISGDDGRRCVSCDPDGEPYWCYLPKYDHDSTEDAYCEPVPEYSTDIAAAWMVVEKMEVRNPCLTLVAPGVWRFVLDASTDPLDLETTMIPDMRAYTTHKRRVKAEGPAPLAICLAALQAAATKGVENG